MTRAHLKQLAFVLTMQLACLFGILLFEGQAPRGSFDTLYRGLVVLSFLVGYAGYINVLHKSDFVRQAPPFIRIFSLAMVSLVLTAAGYFVALAIILALGFPMTRG